MKNKVKKILLPVSKGMALTFTLAFGVLTVGTTIANANASVITSYLGGGGTNIVYIDNGEVSTDNDYYKSEYSSVKEVRGAGIDFTQTTMEEGAVLLRNENNALPLSSTDKVSLFSASSAKSVVSGYRESGKGNDAVSFKDAFKDAGIDVNEDLYNWYANSSYGRKSVMGHTGFANVYAIGVAPWSALPESKTAAGYNTAVFVVSRISGEASDVQLRDLGESRYTSHAVFDGKNGNYLLLSAEEEDVLQNLKAEKDKGTFDKIVVILNTTNQVACDFEDKYGVDALLYTGSTGSAGTRGIANLLKGSVNPSGKLSDTFWKNHYLNPVLANWGAYGFNSGNSGAPYSAYPYANNTGYAAVVYQEGIYSGYRYTETRYEDKILGTAGVGEFNYGEVVAYPFGYGLSYTNFNYGDMAINYNAETDSFEISVKVTNAGGVAGKESVQLFLQKPYTDYDKEKGIEKASVELVDFAKTAKLESGADETVNFTVARRELASYDSYGEKTYIVENGDYRFVVGHDAHDAVNNILADKEKTGMTDISGATVAGDKALVKTVTVGDGDNLYKAYAKSANGTDITNRFDDVDLKLYEHSGDKEKLNYITRNNWSGTVKLGFNADGTQISDSYYRPTMTAGMLAAMNPNPDALAVAGDLPVMGSTETAWQLIDMIQDEEGNRVDIPYDDEKWEQLLNQLTYAEMAEFLSDAYGFTYEINSISKPKTTDQDSDLGVINAYSFGSSGLANKLADPDKDLYPAAYVDNGIVAATRNPELLYEYGLQWGEDCLWAGYSGLYGTGGNIHRSPYGGRNYGYYSEDPVLMGKCVSQINVGMEEKGSFMMMKHCMLNEQEAGRIGMSSWANEQTIREVYLKPFQIAIEEGGVQGVMTSLNRLGTLAAPHHPFMNTVLRGEFGMRGYNVTDSWMPYNASKPSEGHMELISCLIAGNDLPLGGASVLKNNEAKYNTREYANVVWAMRNATHNVLYSVAHSNAMNGMSKNTRIITFQPEWQYYLDRINPAVAVLFGISVAFFVGMEVWSYFGNGKKAAKAGESDGEPEKTGGDAPDGEN